MMRWPYDSITGIPEPTQKFISEVAGSRDILVLAIRMEKGALDFYKAAQQEPKLLKAKGILEMLEKAEEKHMQQLYSRLSSMVGKEALPSLDKLVQDAKASYMEGGLEINQALLELEKKFSGELDVLEIGIEKEYMAYDFYKRATVLVTDTDSKSLLQELAQEERNHSSILLNRLAQIVRQK